MEYWDLYNKDRIKINKLHIRGEKVNPGEYFIIVSGWIMNSDNKLLLSQRHPEKSFPLTWECNTGAVLMGEDSISGVLREVEEEIGIKLQKENGILLETITVDKYSYIKDIYLFFKNINIEETKLQENEVINVKWASIEELEQMAENKEITPFALIDMKAIKEYVERKLMLAQ